MATNTGGIGQHKRGSIDIITGSIKKNNKKGTIWKNKIKSKKKLGN